MLLLILITIFLSNILCWVVVKIVLIILLVVVMTVTIISVNSDMILVERTVSFESVEQMYYNPGNINFYFIQQ